MTDQTPNVPQPREPRDYPQARRRGNLLARWTVWLLPLGVLAVCGYLINKNVVHTGPTVKISFSGPAQVEVNKTPLRYKGVEIGRVKGISLTPDLQHVVVKVRLEKFAKAFALTGAQYWIVRPQITSTGIQGIDTLTQGAYLSATPGKGAEQKNFTALSDDPDHTMGPNAMKIVLYTDQLDKLKVGAAVQYRGVSIGEVSAVELDPSATFVRVALFIRAPYRKIVNSTSRFVYSSGIQVGFDIKTGVKFKLSPWPTLLNGAIDISTAKFDAPALDNTKLQKLYPPLSANGDDKKAAEGSYHLTLTAKTVVKLAQGSEVLYRGLPVGQVDSIVLNKGHDDVQIHISIQDQYVSLINKSSKFWYSNGIQTDFSLFHGAKIQFAGIPVLLNGAIDFVTPDQNAPRLPANSIGPMFDSYRKEWGPM